MGKVTIICELQLERLAGAAEFEIPVGQSMSLKESLTQLSLQAKPELRAALFSPASELNPGILAFVNDRMVAVDSLQDARVQDGDTILLYPAISGG